MEGVKRANGGLEGMNLNIQQKLIIFVGGAIALALAILGSIVVARNARYDAREHVFRSTTGR